MATTLKNKTRIQGRMRAGKWGNSVGVRLPEAVVKQSGIRAGSSISVRVVSKGVFIEKQDREPTLDELLDRVTLEERNHDLAWEQELPRGREIW